MRRGLFSGALALLLALQVGTPAHAEDRMRWVPPAHVQGRPVSATSERVTVKLPSNWSLYGLTQHDAYMLAVQPGTLEISITGDAKSGGGFLYAYNLESGEWYLDESINGTTDQTFSFEIEEASFLHLVIDDNQLAAVTVSGIGLSATPSTPAIAPPLAPYTTVNVPTAIQPSLMNPAETESLQAVLGWDDPMSENLLQEDGSIATFTLDTRGFSEGIHELFLLGGARESGNMSALFLPILVDRTPAFQDVPMTHWAHHPIEVLFHQFIIRGRDRDHFAPDEAVTRAEFAAMLVNTLNLPFDFEAKHPFADVPDDWSAFYIAALYQAGLANGEEVDGRLYFYPNRQITRAEAATLMGRAMNRAEIADYTPIFRDWESVPSWAQPAVANLAKIGWISGFPDGTYQPQAQLTRAQAAKVLAKHLGM